MAFACSLRTCGSSSPRSRLEAICISCASTGGGAGWSSITCPTRPSAAPTSPTGTVITSTGLKPGAVKHVWLIILENKSYDATFTGLNQNSYLWKTLPRQGALLKDYYGTGHFSLDNYLSLVSGQATEPDTQADCPFYDTFAGHVSTSGTLRSS